MFSSTTAPTNPSGVPSTRSPALLQTSASGEIDLLTKHLGEKKEELRAANARNHDMSEQLANLKYQIEDLTDAALLRGDSIGATTSGAHAGGKQRKIHALESQNEELKADIANLEKGISELETPAFLKKMAEFTDEDLRIETEKLKTKNDGLNELVRRKETTIAILEQKLKSHEADVEKSTDLTKTLENSERMLKAAKSLLQEEITISRKQSSAHKEYHLKRPSARTIEDSTLDDAVEADIDQLIKARLSPSYNPDDDSKGQSQLALFPARRESSKTGHPSGQGEQAINDNGTAGLKSFGANTPTGKDTTSAASSDPARGPQPSFQRQRQVDISQPVPCDDPIPNNKRKAITGDDGRPPSQATGKRTRHQRLLEYDPKPGTG